MSAADPWLRSSTLEDLLFANDRRHQSGIRLSIFLIIVHLGRAQRGQYYLFIFIFLYGLQSFLAPLQLQHEVAIRTIDLCSRSLVTIQGNITLTERTCNVALFHSLLSLLCYQISLHTNVPEQELVLSQVAVNPLLTTAVALGNIRKGPPPN